LATSAHWEIILPSWFIGVSLRTAALHE